ncbi:hypothetical protein F442_04921 [Phytophthora nicotianae P10297]|uniref:HTH psq-type domain-containing protein n=3 Tax=Phytophthora nicotianae TaxID=4792 RepID=V9FK85_PHYNI|nr:hypothetical protein F443_04852 [Phytophthora nicotianae P1569]ETK91772.1 hypothetical protein L915_04719 [Phytophthora nicotianae]ETP49574.1 hypothetical protein F442_04921 [Phytophthora nicotianae P10297]
MPRRPTNWNRKKILALELLDEAGSATAAAKALSVHRSALYRWRNSRKAWKMQLRRRLTDATSTHQLVLLVAFAILL